MTETDAISCSQPASVGADDAAFPDLETCREWTVRDVQAWAKRQGLNNEVIRCLVCENIDGCDLLELSEDDIRDFRYRLNYNLCVSDIKKLWVGVRTLQQCHSPASGGGSVYGMPMSMSMPMPMQPSDSSPLHRIAIVGSSQPGGMGPCMCALSKGHNSAYYAETCLTHAQHPSCSTEGENLSPPMSVDGRATNIPPEIFKTAISLGYSFLVTWITSFVMVIVHERVPDMKRYPPLPDIFLDNVPHIPWAFHMCEITGTLLFSIWSCVCIFHKYRLVLLRRFFALAGTVFLLRCVTMLITSLSVPGTHLQCNQNDYAIDDTELTLTEALQLRISRAYTIWSGLGMSIQGVRTCGDYMFSGHTVALTLLNFFITEYTPRNLYFLHTLTWLLNMFGIFFILAAHEHYSIDVFVAFYITSRLFLYYHTLANNHALMSHDSNRTRIWFPMFSYFESSIDGIVPNEYDTVGTLFENLFHFLLHLKDSCMLTARRFWIEAPHLNMPSSKIPFLSPVKTVSSTSTTASSSMSQNQTLIAKSTNTSSCNTPTSAQKQFNNDEEHNNQISSITANCVNTKTTKKYL